MSGWIRNLVVLGISAGFAHSTLALSAFAQSAPQKLSGATTLVNPGSEPRQPLTYHFRQGEFTHYEVVNKSAMTMQYQQLVETVKNESTAWKQFRVISVDEQGSAILEPLVQRVKMSATFNDSPPIVCDSEKPDEASHQFKDVLNTVNKPVAHVHVAANGELLKVTLLDGAPESLAASTSATGPQLNFLVAFPTEPLGVGAIWKDRFEVPVTVEANLKQNVTLQRTFELTKLENQVATINLKTSVITPLSNPQIELQLMHRTPAGVIEFDLAKGCILSQRTVTSKTIVGAFGAQSQASGSMETVERWLPASEVAPAKLETTSNTR